MHMSHAETLRHHFAGRTGIVWTDREARWTEDGEAHLLVLVDGPLAADALVDLHLRALATGARVHVAHAGAASVVAQRTAARFGLALLDVDALAPPVAPSPPEPVADIERAWASATAAMEPHDAPVIPEPPPGPAHPFPLPPSGFFRALERVDAGAAWGLAADVAFDVPPEPELVVAASQAEPELAHADDAMPWDLSLSTPEPEPVHVEPMELLAMPWSPQGEQDELLPAGRATRYAPQRPSLVAQDWGLPWPRPVAPTGGLAIQDPAMWHAKERLAAVRSDLDAIGAPSFGAAKPEGSTWLKRLSEFP